MAVVHALEWLPHKWSLIWFFLYLSMVREMKKGWKDARGAPIQCVMVRLKQFDKNHGYLPLCQRQTYIEYGKRPRAWSRIPFNKVMQGSILNKCQKAEFPATTLWTITHFSRSHLAVPSDDEDEWEQYCFYRRKQTIACIIN
jgi:hypothetical protein